MTVIELRKRAETAEDGESVLGLADTGSHACYMIYGIVRPGQTQRLVKPGSGHEEIVLAVKGGFTVSGAFDGRLEEGQAVHLAGDVSVYLENRGEDEAVYIISGGHSDGGHHH